jgi:hypothetical protein
MTRRRFPVLDGAGLEIAALEIYQEQGHWWVERSLFVTAFRHIVDDKKIPALVRAIENHQWAALDSVDDEFLPWFCRDCGCNHAEEQWRISSIVEEDESGELNSRRRGTCPKGHERTVVG